MGELYRKTFAAIQKRKGKRAEPGFIRSAREACTEQFFQAGRIEPQVRGCTPGPDLIRGYIPSFFFTAAEIPVHFETFLKYKKMDGSIVGRMLGGKVITLGYHLVK